MSATHAWRSSGTRTARTASAAACPRRERGRLHGRGGQLRHAEGPAHGGAARLSQDGRGDPSLCVCRKTDLIAVPNIDACTSSALSSDTQTLLRADTTVACLKYDDTLEGLFRTPSLLNVAETPPYFHSGLAKTLEEVLWFYNQGGGTSGFVGTKSPELRPLGLSDNEIKDLLEFLKSLSGKTPAQVAAEAKAAAARSEHRVGLVEEHRQASPDRPGRRRRRHGNGWRGRTRRHGRRDRAAQAARARRPERPAARRAWVERAARRALAANPAPGAPERHRAADRRRAAAAN